MTKKRACASLNLRYNSTATETENNMKVIPNTHGKERDGAYEFYKSGDKDCVILRNGSRSKCFEDPGDIAEFTEKIGAEGSDPQAIVKSYF